MPEPSGTRRILPADQTRQQCDAVPLEQAVTGNAPVKRNRFIQLSGGTRSVNRDLKAKAKALVPRQATLIW
jgi:hypothetical protein